MCCFVILLLSNEMQMSVRRFSAIPHFRGLFSFNQADKYEEVSIGSVDKEAETNEKKTSKRDIIVVDDKELLARNSERIPKSTKKVTFWCLNVVLFVSACNAMRVGVLRQEYYF